MKWWLAVLLVFLLWISGAFDKLKIPSWSDAKHLGRGLKSAFIR
jgi:hypothetical protein